MILLYVCTLRMSTHTLVFCWFFRVTVSALLALLALYTYLFLQINDDDDDDDESPYDGVLEGT